MQYLVCSWRLLPKSNEFSIFRDCNKPFFAFEWSFKQYQNQAEKKESCFAEKTKPFVN